MCTSNTHLLVHGWQVPYVTDQGPAGHHSQQVTDHAILRTVPKSIAKLWVILWKKHIDSAKGTTFKLEKKVRAENLTRLKYLNGYRVYGSSNFKTSLFKHHDRCVVNTGSYREHRQDETEQNGKKKVFSVTPRQSQTATKHTAKTTTLTSL